jgi:hypothetical protein
MHEGIASSRLQRHVFRHRLSLSARSPKGKSFRPRFSHSSRERRQALPLQGGSPGYSTMCVRPSGCGTTA